MVLTTPRTQYWSWCTSKCSMYEKRLLTLRRTTNFVHSCARRRVSFFFEFSQQLACESADCGLSALFFFFVFCSNFSRVSLVVGLFVKEIARAGATSQELIRRRTCPIQSVCFWYNYRAWVLCTVRGSEWGVMLNILFALAAIVLTT